MGLALFHGILINEEDNWAWLVSENILDGFQLRRAVRKKRVRLVVWR